MAKSKDNVLVKCFSGTIGKQVILKNYGKYVILSAKPVFKGVWTKKQKENRRRFALAAKSAASQYRQNKAAGISNGVTPVDMQNDYNLVVGRKLKEMKRGGQGGDDKDVACSK